MRSILLAAASTLVMAEALHAADLPIDSKVTAVTAFTNGALVTRAGKVTMEPGEHTLVFSNLPVGLDPESLRSEVLTGEGDWYNATLVDKTVQAIADRVGSLGYAFVDVRPRIKRDAENWRRNTIEPRHASDTAQPTSTAFEWNSGMDT